MMVKVNDENNLKKLHECDRQCGSWILDRSATKAGSRQQMATDDKLWVPTHKRPLTRKARYNMQAQQEVQSACEPMWQWPITRNCGKTVVDGECQRKGRRVRVNGKQKWNALCMVWTVCEHGNGITCTWDWDVKIKAAKKNMGVTLCNGCDMNHVWREWKDHDDNKMR